MSLTKNEILRHLLATISYRFTNSINGASSDFFDSSLPNGIRSPALIIRHMVQVLNVLLASIEEREAESIPTSDYNEDLQRFFLLLKAADVLMQNREIENDLTLKLIQGPLADILSHIGQLSMIRRYTNNPVPGENFTKAQIQMGVLERENQILANNENENAN